MATSYQSPGVYVEEVPSAMQAIAGVGTNTVGFIGVIDDGEVEYPEFLSDNEYQKKLLEVQAKIYGKDEDNTKAAAVAKQGPLNVALGKAKQDLADADDKLKPNSPAPKALSDALTTQAALLPTDPDAKKKSAEKDVADAKKAVTTLQAERAKLQKAFDDAQAEVDRLQNLVAEFDQDGMSDADRIAAAKRSSREAARSQVARYKISKFPLKVPAGQAKKCTNFSEFQARFGPWSAYKPEAAALGDSRGIELNGHQILSHAVSSFFNNGGTAAFVVRVRKDNLAGDLQTALETLESVEAISLVAFPGYSSDTANSSALVAHCEKTKYRFAILDAPATPEDAEGVLDLQQLTYDSPKPVLPARTKHAAVYFPYIEVVDPALQLQQANMESIPSKYRGLVYAPASGAIAGIYARTDVQRGVFKAPANASVLGAQNVKYYISRNAQDGLNPQGVNCIRTLNGDITVWGARTCGGDENGEWRYVNVRRTFLWLAKSIDEGTQWVVFEPNDPTLWGKVRRNLSAFLTGVWRDGALFGTTPEEAFYVKCDAENNPPASREVGKLVIEVGVSIVRPAEFVIIRITQGSNAVTA